MNDCTQPPKGVMASMTRAAMTAATSDHIIACDASTLCADGGCFGISVMPRLRYTVLNALSGFIFCRSAMLVLVASYRRIMRDACVRQDMAGTFALASLPGCYLSVRRRGSP